MHPLAKWVEGLIGEPKCSEGRFRGGGANICDATADTGARRRSDLKGASPPTSREVVTVMLGASRRATN